MKAFLERSAAALVAAAMLASSGGRLAAQQAPAMPAAPLAGGAAAAGGNSYVDAYGNPIVLPASYGAPCNCAPYGGCPDGCGYGDAAYADFGGYGPDQCGPYYFDIAVAGVALTNEDLFQDVPPLASIGVLGPTIIDPDQEFDDYEAGWQIAGRYDLGPLSVLEGTYMGIYDIGFSQTINSVDVAPGGLDNQLASVFSGYGVNPIDGLDEGSTYNLTYDADLQSTELSYRRYWLGYTPRMSGTYLLGFRYVRMTEDLDFNANALGGNSNLHWSDSNDMCGFQAGGDAWVCFRQGLRFGVESKGGVYNNRFEFNHATAIPDPDITNVNFNTDGNQVAFVGEASADLVADILPSFSIRGGYRVLYLNNLATVGNNIFPDEFADNIANSTFLSKADVIYHGFHAGLEYIW